MNKEKFEEGGSFFNPAGFQPVSVGKRLREIRLEKGWTIRKLAKESGLAVNTLSLIENQKSSPSVSTLEQIAMALQIPVSSFFDTQIELQPVVHIKADSRRKMFVNNIRVEDLGLCCRNAFLQPFLVSLPPGEGSGQPSIVHTGVEFVYCLSGIVEYQIKEENYSLHPGDSLVFEASLEHRWLNDQDVDAVYLLLIVPQDQWGAVGIKHFDAADDFSESR